MRSAASHTHCCSHTPVGRKVVGSRRCAVLPMAARAPDGYSSVEAYDAERLKLDAQVGAMPHSRPAVCGVVAVTQCQAVTHTLPPCHTGPQCHDHKGSSGVSSGISRTWQQGGGMEVGDPEKGNNLHLFNPHDHSTTALSVCSLPGPLRHRGCSILHCCRQAQSVGNCHWPSSCARRHFHEQRADTASVWACTHDLPPSTHQCNCNSGGIALPSVLRLCKPVPGMPGNCVSCLLFVHGQTHRTVAVNTALRVCACVVLCAADVGLHGGE